MRITVQSFASSVEAAYRTPSRLVGLPACTIFLNELGPEFVDIACSAALMTGTGISPDSSSSARTNFECRPDSVRPCSSAFAFLL